MKPSSEQRRIPQSDSAFVGVIATFPNVRALGSAYRSRDERMTLTVPRPWLKPKK